MREPLLVLTALAGWLLVSPRPAPGADGPADARALADKFLASLAADAPVTGVFELRHKPLDAAWLKEHKKKVTAYEAARSRKATFSPDETVRVYAWAWDGVREKCEALPGSNVSETFFNTPEAYLEQVGEANYNLNGPDRPAYYRPACYYFLGGVTAWAKTFQKCRFETKPAPDGAPPGTALLVARSEDGDSEARLLLDPNRYTLHGYTLFSGGKIYLSAENREFAKSGDGRLFPTSGRILIYDIEAGKPIFSEDLSARRVSFPKTKAEADAAFAMVIPAKSGIIDRTLNRQIILAKPTSVRDILSGGLASTPIAEPTVDTGTDPHGRGQRPGSRLLWLFAINAVALLGVFGYGAMKALRLRRAKGD